MSRHNSLPAFPIIPVGTDLAEEIISEVTHIGFLDNIGIQVDIVSEDAVGLLQVQVSANYTKDPVSQVVTDPGTWVTITTQAIAAAEPGTTFFDLNQLSAPWIRLLWSYTSGDGEIAAIITGKQL